jgi:hypothetical protein
MMQVGEMSSSLSRPSSPFAQLELLSLCFHRYHSSVHDSDDNDVIVAIVVIMAVLVGCWLFFLQSTAGREGGGER